MCGSTTRGRRWKVAAAAVAVAALAPLVPGGSAPPAGALTPLTGDAAWVAAAYDDLLERPPTAAQLAHRVGQLEDGAPRRTVADQLVGSREHAGVLVDRLYARILGRAADPGSRAYWIDRLQAGERDSTVASFLYGSAELYQRAGGTAAGYVAFLYRDILGREPDPTGGAYWTGRVAAGENRTGLARAWYLSQEATDLRADLVFIDLLNRPPWDPERADWSGRLRRNDLRRIEAALVSTSEAYTLSQKYRPPIRLTASSGIIRTPSISADGRIIAFSSLATDLTPAGSPLGYDIFVLDRVTGRVRAITAGNGDSTVPEVSADGTTVVFQSAATDLVLGDANGRIDVFRAPTAGGPVERLTAGNGDSTAPSTSGDGTVVAFASTATDLVATDPNGAVADVFVRTGGALPTVERIGGAQASSAPELSADGGSVVFVAQDLEGAPPGQQAYLARLPLGPTPEVVQLSEGVGIFTASVSADGSRAAYVVLSEVGNRPASTVYVATIDDTGVTARTKIAGPGFLSEPRIADDGSALLIRSPQGYLISDRLHPADGTPPPLDAVAYLEGTDLSGDAGLVVGRKYADLWLYETR